MGPHPASNLPHPPPNLPVSLPCSLSHPHLAPPPGPSAQEQSRSGLPRPALRQATDSLPGSEWASHQLLSTLPLTQTLPSTLLSIEMLANSSNLSGGGQKERRRCVIIQWKWVCSCLSSCAIFRVYHPLPIVPVLLARSAICSLPGSGFLLCSEQNRATPALHVSA